VTERETPQDQPDTEGAPGLPQREITANMLVAYNMAHWRKAIGLTQEELGNELTMYTGRPWSKATVSAAERAWDGKRVRLFDTDELLALSVALQVPLSALLLPPADDGVSRRYAVKHSDDGEHGLTMGDLIGYLVPEVSDDETGVLAEYSDRLEAAISVYYDSNLYHDLQKNRYGQPRSEALRRRRDELVERNNMLRALVFEAASEIEVISAHLGEWEAHARDVVALLVRNGWSIAHSGKRTTRLVKDGYRAITLSENDGDPYDAPTVFEILTRAGIVEPGDIEVNEVDRGDDLGDNPEMRRRTLALIDEKLREVFVEVGQGSIKRRTFIAPIRDVDVVVALQADDEKESDQSASEAATSAVKRARLAADRAGAAARKSTKAE
jgi:transcriptional regulator with XRE-family HTH domain